MMFNRIHLRSPLADLPASAGRSKPPLDVGVTMSERSFLGHLNLRLNPKMEEILNACRRCLGATLPVDPNTVTISPAVTVLWLGPDEWLLQTSSGREVTIAEQLRATLDNFWFALTNISSSQTVIEIGGKHAVDVLNKGCTLDFHPTVFGPRMCAQTHVAKATVLIRCVDPAFKYEITVRRSYAEYMTLWLEDAAQEYGIAMT